MATQLVATTSSETENEKIQQFFKDLEIRKNILTTCTDLFTKLSNHFSSLEDSIYHKFLSLDSKFQTLESRSKETLDSFDTRENSIPERESSAAATIEEQKEAALAAIQNPVPPSSLEIPDALKSLSRKMDALALLRFIVSKRKESATLRSEIAPAISEAVDPPRLVLDAVEEFLKSKTTTKSGVTDKRWACGLLIQGLSSESAVYSRKTVDRAAGLVDSWKEQLDKESDKGAAEVVMFLQMVVCFGLRSKFDDEYLRKFVMQFASRRDMAKIAASLEFGNKMIDTMVPMRPAAMKALAMKTVDIPVDVEEGDVPIPTSPQNEIAAESAIPVSPINTVTQEDLAHDRIDLVPDSPSPVAHQADARVSEKRARGEAGGEPRPVKKSKTLRRPKHKDKVVPLEEKFLEQTYAQWRADPVGASTQIFLNLAEVHKIEKQKFEQRAEEKLELEKSKRAKLVEDMSLKLKELARVKQELQTWKEKQGETVRRAEVAEARVKELEVQVEELEGSVAEAKGQIRRLEDQIVVLEDDLKRASEAGAGTSMDPDARNAELLAALQQSRKNAKEAARIANEATKEAREAAKSAIELYKEGFECALQQAALVNPSLCLDRALIDVDHEVDGNQIVKIDAKTEEKTVVFLTSDA